MGMFKVIFNPSAWNAEVTRQVEPRIKTITYAVKAKLFELIGGVKSGRWYGAHRASAPGEAPAKRTGTHLRSIRESFPNALTGEIIIGAAYAAFLEYGTRRMAERPLARPAIEAVAARFNSLRDSF